MQKVLMHVYSS